jgi:hypothetical protein
MAKKMPNFGYAKQAQGIISEYFAECEALSKLNNFFWSLQDPDADCYTKYDKYLPGFGCCEYESSKSNTLKITLNFKNMAERADDESDFLLVAKAVDYHEMAHALHAVRWPEQYQPKEGYSRQEVFQTLNILCDQRDELHWLEDYTGTSKFFRYLVMHPEILGKTSTDENMSEDEENNVVSSAFILRWGRRFYLPDKYVDIIVNRFAEKYPNAVEPLKSVIDRFLVSDTFEEQEPLVYEFIDILRDNNISKEAGGQGTVEMDAETFAKIAKNGGMKQGNSNSGGIKVKISGESEDSEESGNSGAEEEQDDTGDSGNGGGGNDVDDTGDLGQMSQNEKDKMQKEAQQMEDEVKQIAQSAGVQSSEDIGDPFQPTSNSLQLKKKIEKIFKDARMDMDSHYVRRLKRGNLDTQLARQGERMESDRIFRKFKPSKIDKLQLSTLLVLDQSGSMGMGSSLRGDTNIQAATDITWAIAAAHQNFDCATSVIGFDVDAKVMKTFDGKMENWYLKATGGTDPGNSFEKALQMFKPYLRQKLPCLCVCVTDGYWYGDQGAMGIKKLNASGVWTAEFLVVANSGDRLESHGCKYTQRVESLADCKTPLEKIIEDIQMETRRKLGG